MILLLWYFVCTDPEAHFLGWLMSSYGPETHCPACLPLLLLCCYLVSDSSSLQHIFVKTHCLVTPARHSPQSPSSWRAARQYFAAALCKSQWLRPQWCWTQTQPDVENSYQAHPQLQNVHEFSWKMVHPKGCCFNICSLFRLPIPYKYRRKKNSVNHLALN